MAKRTKQTELTLDEVLGLIRARVAKAGTLQAAAEELDTSKSVLSEVLNRETLPNPKLLRSLGIQRDLVYRQISKK